MQPHEEFDSPISEDSSVNHSAASGDSFHSLQNLESSQTFETVSAEKVHFPRFFKAIHTLERRKQSMSLDAAYYYLRHLELKLQNPDLYKVCNSIKSIDVVLTDRHGHGDGMRNFTGTAWQKVKEGLFQILITSFAGRFIVYSVTATSPLTSAEEWSENNFVDFYPQKQSRPDEFYSLPLKGLTQANCVILKKSFMEGKLTVKPEDFTNTEVSKGRKFSSTLMRIYDICEQEAERAKSRANSLINVLEAELQRCDDRQRRKEIRRQLVKLQTAWGDRGL